VQLTIYTENPDKLEFGPVTGSEDQPKMCTGLPEFIAFLRKALIIISDPEQPLLLEPAFPDHLVNSTPTKHDPVVTWTVENMLPAAFGGKPNENPNSGHREAGPRLRASVEDEGGELYDIMSMTMHAYIRFDIWTAQAADAERLCEWFRRFFMAYIGPTAGANMLRFHQRKTDKEVSKINNKLHVRSLVYIAQFEEVTAVRTDRIQSITAKIEQTQSTSN
jgi:hypothetical protein